MSKKDLYDIFDNMSANDLDSLDCRDMITDQIAEDSLARIKNKALAKCIEHNKKSRMRFFSRAAASTLAACIVICVGIGIAFSAGPIMNFVNYLKVPSGDSMITVPLGNITDEPLLTSPNTFFPVSGTEYPTDTPPSASSTAPDDCILREKSNMLIFDIQTDGTFSYNEEVFSTFELDKSDSLDFGIRHNKQIDKYGICFKIGFRSAMNGTLKIELSENYIIWVREYGSDEFKNYGSSYEILGYGSKKYEYEPTFFVSYNDSVSKTSKSREGEAKITFIEDGLITEAAYLLYYISSNVTMQTTPTHMIIDPVKSASVTAVRAASFPNVEGKSVTHEYMEAFFTNLDTIEYYCKVRDNKLTTESFENAKENIKAGMYLYEIIAAYGEPAYSDNLSAFFYTYRTESGYVVQIYADETELGNDYLITDVKFVYVEKNLSSYVNRIK